MGQEIKAENAGIVVSPSQIQYTLVTPHTDYKVDEFFDQTYERFRSMPKDLLQLKDPENYFEFCYKAGIKKSINLYTLPDVMFNGTAEENLAIFNGYSGVFNKDLVKVFFIDPKINCHQQLGQMLKLLRYYYFHITGEPQKEIGDNYDLSRAFNTSHQLIELIKKDLPSISQEINNIYGLEINDFDFDSPNDTEVINPYYSTLYCKNNYFTLNQIFGNYWKIRPEEPTQEHLLGSSPYRVQWQIEQIKKMDLIHRQLNNSPVTPIESILPAMVIAAPFHFPRWTKLADFKTKKEKSLFRASQTEQTLDYRYEAEETLVEYIGRDNFAQILALLTKRLLMIDNLSYLHAQFGYGPSLRLPVVGRSINMDLSHFQHIFASKKNAIKKILDIGDLMRKKMVADPLKKLLADRDGQLVFVSDLPMEWLRLGRYPICLTHDVCRLPEFNFSSLINNFVHNQRLNFRIKPDILEKTLVIHCASEDDTNMRQMFAKIDASKADLKFNTAICSSVEEISDAVKLYKPDLLIFDCHGDFDEKTLSSYLIIDGKSKVVLTGDDIIKHGISAPMVFISACSTMPNYGYVKFLSDAFFQAGAFTVTATFLPIAMWDAMVLLIRILNNLKQMESKVIHSNWLSFLSHTLRGVMIFEAVKKEQGKNNLPAKIDQQKIAEILTGLMVFERRESVLDDLNSFLQTLNPAINIVFEKLDHEWLSYTTIGRADLIYFENWLHKHQKAKLGDTY